MVDSIVVGELKMSDDYPYNDDLIIENDDFENTCKIYPLISFSLRFPELISEFCKVDDVALKAKMLLRCLGLSSVGMVLISLTAASAAPFYHGNHIWADVIITAAAIIGILGGAIGLGLFSMKCKEVWLQNRLVVECLRQFHFTLLIRLAPDIVTIAASRLEGAPADRSNALLHEFERKRVAALLELLPNLVCRKAAELTAIIEAPDASPAFRVPPMPPADIFNTVAGAELLSAYGTLRLKRQKQYAEYKLQKRGLIFSAFPRSQAVILSNLSMGCVILLLVLHMISAGIILWDQGHHTTIIDFAAVWIALLALSIRAVEEGLKPHAEIERYRHYRMTCDRIHERFQSGDLTEKLSAIEEMEQAAYEEMVAFLRSYHEARFTM